MADLNNIGRGGGAVMGMELALLLPFAPLAILGCALPRKRNYKPYDRCSGCHTSPNEYPVTEFEFIEEPESVGAHKFHVGKPRWTNPILCSTCHDIPEKGNISHADGIAKVTLEGHNSTEMSCEVFCHGYKKIQWDVTNTEPTLDCGSCHEETSPPHDTDDKKVCQICHNETMDPNGEIKNLDLHINGEVDVAGNPCSPCHEYPPSKPMHLSKGLASDILDKIYNCFNCHPMPISPFKLYPEDPHKNGTTDIKANPCTSCHEEGEPATGAHTSHISPTLTKPISCTTCHDIPSVNLDLLKHIVDREKWPIVQFSGELATGGVYDPDTQTCSNVYCHGAELLDGSYKTPSWGDTTGAAKECGACHGIPYAPGISNHEDVDTNCSACHPSGEVIDKDTHINGIKGELKSN